MSTAKRSALLIAGVLLLGSAVSPVQGAFEVDVKDEKNLTGEPAFIREMNRQERLGLTAAPRRSLPPRLQGSLLASATPVSRTAGSPDGSGTPVPVGAAQAPAKKPAARSRAWQVVLLLAVLGLGLAGLAYRRAGSAGRPPPSRDPAPRSD